MKKKKNTKEKTRKAPGPLDPAVILPPHRVQNMLRSLRIRAQEVKWKSATDLFGRAKTGSPGQVVFNGDHEKIIKKRVLLDPVLTAG